MRKLFISADMEGVSGVTDPEDVRPGASTYEFCRKLLTQDVNAAIEGALQAGIDEVVVNESHGPMRNILVDELHPKAELVRGMFKPNLMMEGLDSTFDAAFFIGYHGKAGEKDAVLNHTFMGSCVHRFILNGKEIDEAAFNAVVAGVHNVPIVLVTGDLQTTTVVKENIPNIHTVSVKNGLGAFAAQSLHPEVAQEKIRAGAKYAIENAQNIVPIKNEPSYTIDIEFILTNMASIVSYMPQVELLDPRTVRYKTNDIREASSVVLAMLLLAAQAS